MAADDTKSRASSALPPVKVRTGVPAELIIHSVADHELENLARGSAESSSYLNFAIFLLSTAVSFLVAILTAVLSQRVFTIFVVVTTVGFLNGMLLLIVWRRKHISVWSLVNEIRSRVPAEGIQEIGEINQFRIQE